MESTILKYILTEQKDIYMFIFWPIASTIDRYHEAKEEIKRQFKVRYEKTIPITRRGMKNLFFHAYRTEPWIGKPWNHFVGVGRYADKAYVADRGAYVLWVESSDADRVLKVKEDIREKIGIGKVSLHSTDNQEETIFLSKVLLNENSVACLNHSRPDKYYSFFNLLQRFKCDVIEKGLNLDRIILDSEAVMSLYGVKKVRAIGFLTDYNNLKWECDQNIENKEKDLKYYKNSIEELLYNPENYILFDDIKFISLDVLEDFKKKRGTDRDAHDIELINKMKTSRCFY